MREIKFRSFTPKKTPTGYDINDVRIVKWSEATDYESGSGLAVGFDVHPDMFTRREYDLTPLRSHRQHLRKPGIS